LAIKCTILPEIEQAADKIVFRGFAMAFFQSFFREKVWHRQGRGEFGRYLSFHNKPRLKSFRLIEEEEDEEKGAYGDPDFYKILDKLARKLVDAELHGDFGKDGTNITYKDKYNYKSYEHFSPSVEHFLKKKMEIRIALRGFKGKSQEEIQQWFQANENLLQEFLVALNNIYRLKTLSAKIKDVLWELADILVAALICVGMAVAVIKGAGIGLLGGAFASLVAPSSTAVAIKAGAAAAGATATGLYKFFQPEKKQITAAIEADLQAKMKRNCSQ
jgi:hypothetical protein